MNHLQPRVDYGPGLSDIRVKPVGSSDIVLVPVDVTNPADLGGFDLEHAGKVFKRSEPWKPEQPKKKRKRKKGKAAKRSKTQKARKTTVRWPKPKSKSRPRAISFTLEGSINMSPGDFSQVPTGPTTGTSLVVRR